MSTARVATLGEPLIGLVALEPGPLAAADGFARFVVGAESNLAIGLARLDVPVALIGRVGLDPLGDTIVRELRAEGVDTSALTRDDTAPTGVLIRGRRGFGPSEVFYQRSGSAGSRLDPADVKGATALIEEAEWLHLTGITPLLSESCADSVRAAVAIATAAGTKVCVDVNLRRKLWGEGSAELLDELLAQADLVLSGADELLVVTRADTEEAAIATLRATRADREIVIKRGADGASAYVDGTVVHAAARPVSHVLDVVGAGDAFAAGYLCALLAGRPVEERLELGNVCGAFAVTTLGDAVGLPTAAEAHNALLHAEGEVIR
jgi:2-dehydro-3-deoxygluconokinase